MKADGTITIETKINKKGFEKQLKDLENEKVNDVEIEPEVDSNKVQQEVKEAKEKIKDSDKKVTYEFEFDEGYEEQISLLEAKIEELIFEYNALANEEGFDEQSIEARELAAEIEKNINQLNALKKKQEDIGKDKNFKSIGNEIEKIIKKIGKWALAVFGIRSAYMFVRQAVSTLSQYNKQMAADIQYLRYAIANTLQGVIEALIRGVYTLLSYINYLAKAWFNVNLFENASVNNFKKVNSEAKKLSKTLAGFDEVNTVSSNASSSGVGTPGFDLSKLPTDDEVPKWLQTVANIGKKVVDMFKKIKDNWKTVLVVGGILAITIGAIWLALKLLTKGDISKGVENLATGFGRALEAIAIFGGMALVIQSITDLITAFAESDLSLIEVAELLGIALGEIIVAFTLLAAATKLMDWKGLAGAVVILGGMALILHELNDLVKTFSENGLELSDVGGLLAVVLGTIIGLMAAVALLGPLMTAGLIPFLAVIGGISALLAVMALTLPTILDAVSDFIVKTAPSAVNILNAIADLIERIARVIGDVLIGLIREMRISILALMDGILKFINGLGPAINNFVDGVISAITKLINFVISGIEYLINTLIVNSINGLLRKVKENKIAELLGFDKKITLLGQVSIARFRPKLARGAIINQPGRGVPVGSGRALAGEAGKEGIFPLTNSQAMEELGSTIGRYITIDLTNITNFDGRAVARNQSQVNADKNFLLNR